MEQKAPWQKLAESFIQVHREDIKRHQDYFLRALCRVRDDLQVRAGIAVCQDLLKWVAVEGFQPHNFSSDVTISESLEASFVLWHSFCGAVFDLSETSKHPLPEAMSDIKNFSAALLHELERPEISADVPDHALTSVNAK